MALLARQPLTKAFLMSLATGRYLTSNTYRSGSSGEPCFAETVVPAEQREAQWQRIKAARVNGRLCNVFACPEDRDRWVNAVRLQWRGGA